MKKILVLILFILISDSVYSYQKMTDAQLKSIINSPSRIVNDLSGTWQVEYDGESYSRFVPYSDLSSDQIIITKNVIIPNEAKEAYTWHLYFLGIENQVEVYWNEQFIGRYFDAVIPFELKIPDNLILRKGNKIKLIISKYDGIRDKIQSTHLFAKKNFIGPIREILLVGKPQIWISDIQPKVQFSNNYSNAYLNVGFTISSSNIRNLINNLIQRDSLNVGFSNKLSVNYQVILIDRQSGAQVASSDILSTSIESERSEIMLSKLSLSYPKMWSPNTPFIYDIKVKLTKNDKLIDEINQEFGFKDIKLIRSSNRSTILLNGEELKIKGISYIEDYEKSGQSISANRLKEDIESMKILGTNLIRAKYSPPSPFLVHLCNIYGIMLMIDLPVYDQPASLLEIDEVKVLLKNNINQYLMNYLFNPSLFAIGLSEGNLNKDIYSSQYKDFLKKVKSNSSVLYSQIIPLGNANSLIIKDADIIGIRATGVSLSLDKFSNEFKKSIDMISNKPIFLDYGVLIQPNNHNGYSDQLSIEYQSYIIQNYNRLVELNGISGSIYNTFNDYLRYKPLLIANNDNLYLNSSGIVTRSRVPRFSYSTLQSVYNNDKEPLLNTGSFKPYSPYTFIIFSLFLLILLFVIINSFKRFREYIFRSLLRPYNFYSDIRDQRIISISLTIILGLIVSFNIGIYLSSIFYYFKTSLSFQYVIMMVMPMKSLQEVMVKLVWMPELSVLFISLLTFVLAFVAAGIIKLFSLAKSNKIVFNDCLILSIWGAIPSLLLLPFSVVLYRVLLAVPYSLTFFIFIFIFIMVWTVARLAKSISVVFEIKTGKVGLITIGLLVSIILVVFAYYQLEFSFFSYLNYMLSIIL